MIDLASLLLFQREQRGLSLRAAAKAIGVSNPYLSQLETGKVSNPTLDVVQRLTRVYHIKPHVWMQIKTKPGAYSALRASKNGEGSQT
jgi:transcriptional regulator with XRE-family HTH domain